MNLNSYSEREAHAGELIRTFTAICFFCREQHPVGASSKAEAQKALRAAQWHTTGGRWYCNACYGRQQGYREIERRSAQGGALRQFALEKGERRPIREHI